MIIQLSNPLMVSHILALAKSVPNVPLEHLEKMLLSAINDKDSAIYIDEKDGDVNGFVLVSREVWEGEPVCFLQFAVIKPIREEKYIGFELLAKIRLWAKDKGLKKIITVVRRNVDGFKKKYHFELDGYLLQRSV